MVLKTGSGVLEEMPGGAPTEATLTTYVVPSCRADGSYRMMRSPAFSSAALMICEPATMDSCVALKAATVYMRPWMAMESSPACARAVTDMQG